MLNTVWDVCSGAGVDACPGMFIPVLVGIAYFGLGDLGLWARLEYWDTEGVWRVEGGGGG